MTIAAAMRCSEGIIMCADSLVSGGEVNLTSAKLLPFNVPGLQLDVVIGYSGTVSYCLSAISDISEMLQAQGGNGAFIDAKWFRNALSELLTEFHARHIFPHPRFGYADGPSVQIIVAVKQQFSGETWLFRSTETAVNHCSERAVIGAGEAIAESVIEPLILIRLSQMKREDVLLLADHVLHQVKRFVPGCGDQSQFFFVSQQIGFCHLTPQVLLPEERSETWQRIVAELFYASANLDLDDESVSIGLTLTDSRISRIREEQKSERERREKLGPRVFTSRIIGLGPDPIRYVPKPSISHSSEGLP